MQIRRIRKILASWIQIHKNMRVHGSGYKGQNINQKLQKRLFFNSLSKPKYELLKKRDYKTFLISEWFIKFWHKNKGKNKTKNLKIL